MGKGTSITDSTIMHTSTKPIRRGFTLVEALLASAVLAMAITGIVMPFTIGAQNEMVDARRTLALDLAEELMEEILSRPFNDPDGPSNPGPESGEVDRDEFDNIDDYHGFSEGAGQIKNIDGEVVSGSAAMGLSRQASVAYVYVSGQDMSDPPTFVKIVVAVKYRQDTIISLTRLAYLIP